VDIGTEILRGLGYKVTGFTESGKALKYLTEHAAEVNLVISDMTMPKITGLELAQNLQQLDVPPPVIICTGHTEGLTRNQARESGIFSFLLKPVTVHNLAVTVRAVLDGNISEQY
jgi:CheY-like chemotaxis protein